MTNMGATDVADGRPCPAPATEALKVFMTQHVHQSKSASSSTDHPPRPVSEDGDDDDDKNIEPLDLSELCREAIRVEHHAYDSASAVTDDDAFPCIAWNSDDDDDNTEDEESDRTNENHPLHLSKKRPRHQKRRASHQESSRRSSCEDVRQGNTTTRKRRSSEPFPQACGLHRCKTRKMCLPRCIDQQNDNCCDCPMPDSNSKNAPLSTSRQQSLSVGSSLDNTSGSTTPDLDPAAFLVATCLSPQATSWGQFALTGSNPSTPNSPSYGLIRTSPSRCRTLRNSFKRANSFGNVILPLRSNDQ